MKMINEVIIIGTYKSEEGFIQLNGKKYLHILVEVEKAFINNEGFYEKDRIDCLLWKGEADRLLALAQDCHWISLKGRLEKHADQMYVMAEKIKYLDRMIHN
ncbi:hypothetical protein [Beduini sp.]|uniref:hypothetical protein n=2 Tax=Beduini sp. TaxID=1922300 RepID=UPI0039907793